MARRILINIRFVLNVIPQNMMVMIRIAYQVTNHVVLMIHVDRVKVIFGIMATMEKGMYAQIVSQASLMKIQIIVFVLNVQ